MGMGTEAEVEGDEDLGKGVGWYRMKFIFTLMAVKGVQRAKSC